LVYKKKIVSYLDDRKLVAGGNTAERKSCAENQYVSAENQYLSAENQWFSADTLVVKC